MYRRFRESPRRLERPEVANGLARGAPIHLVQATLGHASVATTRR
jgi:hypothetical protein